MQTKTDYLEGTTLQLDLWGDQFASLEHKVAFEVEKDRQELMKQLQSLKRRKRALKLKLREAAHGTTKTQWEDVREDLEEAVGDFRSLAVEVYDKVRRAS